MGHRERTRCRASRCIAERVVPRGNDNAGEHVTAIENDDAGVQAAGIGHDAEIVGGFDERSDSFDDLAPFLEREVEDHDEQNCDGAKCFAREMRVADDHELRALRNEKRPGPHVAEPERLPSLVGCGGSTRSGR